MLFLHQLIVWLLSVSGNKLHLSSPHRAVNFFKTIIKVHIIEVSENQHICRPICKCFIKFKYWRVSFLPGILSWWCAQRRELPWKVSSPCCLQVEGVLSRENRELHSRSVHIPSWAEVIFSAGRDWALVILMCPMTCFSYDVFSDLTIDLSCLKTTLGIYAKEVFLLL